MFNTPRDENGLYGKNYKNEIENHKKSYGIGAIVTNKVSNILKKFKAIRIHGYDYYVIM